MAHEPSDDPSIDRYLEAARQLWPEDQPPPELDELREIAESVDMTDEASGAADRRAGALTREARQALEAGEVSRAESMLRDAVLLSPVRLQPLYVLARLYARRYGDDGDERDRERALELTDRALEIDPEHTPTRTLVEKMGTTPQDGLPWKTAAMIVAVIVFISGTMQLCDRYMGPEVTDEQTEEVREYLEEHEEPTR